MKSITINRSSYFFGIKQICFLGGLLITVCTLNIPTAQKYLSSMNKSVDPCEDFYEFACGGWKSVSPKPSDELYWSQHEMVTDLTNRRIKAILETKSEPDEILPVKQVKNWYQSCMNTDEPWEKGVRMMGAIMQQIGGWPMTMNEGEWHENEYTWQRVQRDYAHFTGSYTFYDIFADNPKKGQEFGPITINIPKLFGDGDDISRLLLEEPHGQHFSGIMETAQKFAQYNRASVPTSRLIKESEELVIFLKALAKLIPGEDMGNGIWIEKLDYWYNLDKTDSESASPESETYLSSVVEDAFNLVNITLRPRTVVYPRRPRYVKEIGHLLKQTPQRTIVNYIHWNFIQKMWPFIRHSTVPRWLECVRDVKMKHAISFAYVKKHYTKTESIKAQKMIENIRAGLQQKIENSNWMDSESKNLLKQKLKSLKNYVGFPEWYTNNTAIINYYKGLEIGSDYLENKLSYMRYEGKRKLERYLIPELENDPFRSEESTPISFTAAYFSRENFAAFSAANFQPPHFGNDYPDAVNYGATGMMMGHEMSHAFDSCGITYGAANEKNRLNEMILRSFYERVGCFVDQYDEYNGNPKVENGKKWDCDNEGDVSNKSEGQKTAAENIADTTGLQAVYQAYEKLAKDIYVKGESEVRLPGLEKITADQLLFLSYAEKWCRIHAPQSAPSTPHTHSIGRLRVIGPVSNTIGFARAFNCPIGSPMNPVNKCSVWDKPDAKMNQAPKRKNRHS